MSASVSEQLKQARELEQVLTRVRDICNELPDLDELERMSSEALVLANRLERAADVEMPEV